VGATAVLMLKISPPKDAVVRTNGSLLAVSDGGKGGDYLLSLEDDGEPRATNSSRAATKMACRIRVR
jgi:hypothetical protein